jgi:lipopolysaccharide export LptBFGC system permease protein LptF
LAQTAVRMKAELKFGPGAAPTNSAWWTRDGPRLVGLDRRSGFPAVTVLELDAQGDVAALGEADTVTVGSNAEVAYERYRETRFDAERSSTRASPRQVEQSAAVKSLLNVSQGTQRFASMRQLNAQREQLLRAKLGNTAAVYEINERLAQTVLGPLLAILALPIVLGLLRSAKQGARLVLGLVIGFGLTILQDVASSVVSVFGAPPALLAWSPILLTLLVLLYMLRSLQPPARQAGSA